MSVLVYVLLLLVLGAFGMWGLVGGMVQSQRRSRQERQDNVEASTVFLSPKQLQGLANLTAA